MLAVVDQEEEGWGQEHGKQEEAHGIQDESALDEADNPVGRSHLGVVLVGEDADRVQTERLSIAGFSARHEEAMYCSSTGSDEVPDGAAEVVVPKGAGAGTAARRR